jgi:hypothetical protein
LGVLLKSIRVKGTLSGMQERFPDCRLQLDIQHCLVYLSLHEDGHSSERD